jgi:hypothetical protein
VILEQSQDAFAGHSREHAKAAQEWS